MPLFIGSQMLYKYIGSNDAENVVRNLKRFIDDGTISASPPSSFNDPSEFKVSIKVEGTPDELQKAYKTFEDPELTFDEWLAVAPETSRIVAQDLRREALGNFGVVCLTPVANSILMWSHYSASHKGFCIGFDDEFVKDVQDFHSFDAVRYMGSVPNFNYAMEDMHALFQKLFFYKDSCWFYENEKRIITKSIGVKTFDKKHIKEVCLGHNVDPLVEENARILAKQNPNIKFWKMTTLDDGYELTKITL